MDVPNYTAGQLLNIYNNVVGRHGMNPKFLGPTGYAAIARFGKWCQQQGIDPATYIHYRVGATGWRFHVSVEKLIPKTKKSLERFHDWEGFEASCLGEERKKEKIGHNAYLWSNRLRPIGEVMKRQLRRDPESCLYQTDLTGGWNPRSELCAECPVAQQCVDQLPDEVRRRRYVGSG